MTSLGPGGFRNTSPGRYVISTFDPTPRPICRFKVWARLKSATLVSGTVACCCLFRFLEEVDGLAADVNMEGSCWDCAFEDCRTGSPLSAKPVAVGSEGGAWVVVENVARRHIRCSGADVVGVVAAAAANAFRPETLRMMVRVRSIIDLILVTSRIRR